ncbi:hypothetical protein OG21DRAFT_1490545 [Imleria badia]|nr:hypothetical protein OG21DRAFT_1490545 [Imleria badia]
MQLKYVRQIDEQVGLPMGPVGPEIKAMNPPKCGKYGGQDDLKRFDDWVSQLLKYYRMFTVTKPNRDEDQVLYTRLFLEGIASKWYNQEIESPDRRTLYWSFEDLICGLFKCFVHKVSAQNATNQYDQTRFNHEKGVLAFYNNLRCHSYRMVQPPDDYSFKRKFICGLPHSIIKTIFEACRISAEHSTIEGILDEVQQKNPQRQGGINPSILGKVIPFITVIQNFRAIGKESVGNTFQRKEQQGHVPNKGKPPPKFLPGIQCFKCNKEGHMANECPEKMGGYHPMAK